MIRLVLWAGKLSNLLGVSLIRYEKINSFPTKAGSKGNKSANPGFQFSE